MFSIVVSEADQINCHQFPDINWYQETEKHFQTHLTYKRFMGDATESLSITGEMEAAGEVVVNAVLHWVSLLLVWLLQQCSIIFNPQKTLEVVCLFSFLRDKDNAAWLKVIHIGSQPQPFFQHCQGFTSIWTGIFSGIISKAYLIGVIH